MYSKYDGLMWLKRHFTNFTQEIQFPYYDDDGQRTALLSNSTPSDFLFYFVPASLKPQLTMTQVMSYEAVLLDSPQLHLS